MVIEAEVLQIPRMYAVLINDTRQDIY
jgi:hypothetical protein